MTTLAPTARHLAVSPSPTHSRFDLMTLTAAPFAHACDVSTRHRLLALLDRHHPLREAFVDLEELVVEYLHDVPFPDDRSHVTDAARFVGWLETSYGLTPKQRDSLETVHATRSR
jgi:hypothetical protein